MDPLNLVLIFPVSNFELELPTKIYLQYDRSDGLMGPMEVHQKWGFLFPVLPPVPVLLENSRHTKVFTEQETYLIQPSKESAMDYRVVIGSIVKLWKDMNIIFIHHG